MTVDARYRALVADLEAAGRASAYRSDADETDPRYRAYGVRAVPLRAILRTHRAAIRALDTGDRLELATRLIESGIGEQQSVAFSVLATMPGHFTPENLDILDGFTGQLYGWSKVDGFTGEVMQPVLLNHPDAVVALAREWSRSPGQWKRRTSVVLFTRKVAASGRFIDVALELCERLAWDPEDLVQKGVGWCLKDHLPADRERVLAYVRDLRARGAPATITLYAIRGVRGPERDEIIAIRPGKQPRR